MLQSNKLAGSLAKLGVQQLRVHASSRVSRRAARLKFSIYLSTDRRLISETHMKDIDECRASSHAIGDSNSFDGALSARAFACRSIG